MKLVVVVKRGMKSASESIQYFSKICHSIHSFIFCSVLYLPKNIYKDRSLPYIIGSKEWQENRHIGITKVEDISKDGDVDDLQGSTGSLSSSDTSNRSVASDTTENESHFEDEDQLFDEKGILDCNLNAHHIILKKIK